MGKTAASTSPPDVQPLPPPAPRPNVPQAVGEPEGAATAECALTAARAAGDDAAAAAAELHLMAALLRGQYGPARVDEAAGSITLQVGVGPGRGGGEVGATVGGRCGAMGTS